MEIPIDTADITVIGSLIKPETSDDIQLKIRYHSFSGNVPQVASTDWSIESGDTTSVHTITLNRNMVINNGQSSRVKVRIDSENYRDKRNKTLESLAKSVANTVRKTHKDYELEPMTSYERRIIHSVLQKEKNIETTSIGTDKERHVVVKYRR